MLSMFLPEMPENDHQSKRDQKRGIIDQHSNRTNSTCFSLQKMKFDKSIAALYSYK